MKQNKFKLVSKEYLTIISGPCAIESEKTAMFTAEYYITENMDKLVYNLLLIKQIIISNSKRVGITDGLGLNKVKIHLKFLFLQMCMNTHLMK